MDNMLIDMVIKGKIRVEWTPDGEPQFNSVNDSAHTQKGRERGPDNTQD